MMLNTEMTLTNHDATYQELMAAHKGLSAEQSASLNARLILILANQIGDEKTISQAIKLAMETATPSN